MKKNFTLLLAGLCTVAVGFAGTPTIDGNFDGTGVWGEAVGTGDGNAGWSEANAKKLYVTYDANYVYFGAECTAQAWQQYIFVINTKVGGGTNDPWGRTITYNHANKPDFLFRGDIAGSNYSERHIWGGTDWTGLGTNTNATGTEVKGIFNTSNEGFIEIRVPRDVLGTADVSDVQFIIGGNNGGVENGHGCFDAIPNDNNGSAWSAPGNATTLSNYVTNVLLPANLGVFSGRLAGTDVQLQWNTLTETNLAGFDVEKSADASNWQTVGFVAAENKSTGAAYTFQMLKTGPAVSYYRLKVTDKDGSYVHSKLVVLKSQPKTNAELIGNPVTNAINVAIHTPEAELIQAELVDMNGRRVSNTLYHHPGGSSVLQINTTATQSGFYLLRLQGTTTQETIRIVKQ